LEARSFRSSRTLYSALGIVKPPHDPKWDAYLMLKAA
jgi:hypothetical protein